jgi:hypothetical protein
VTVRSAPLHRLAPYGLQRLERADRSSGGHRLMHENVVGARGSQCWGALRVPTRQVVWVEDGHDGAVLQVRVAVTGRRRPCDKSCARSGHASSMLRSFSGREGSVTCGNSIMALWRPIWSI